MPLLILIIMSRSPKYITIKLLEKRANMVIKTMEDLVKQNNDDHKTIHDIIKTGLNGGKP